MKHEQTSVSDENIDFQNYQIADYLNHTFSCSCGREHKAPIRRIHIEEDALFQLPELITEAACTKPFLIYDSTTYQIAGEAAEKLLRQSRIPYSHYILPDAKPVPDEQAAGQIMIHFDRSCDTIIAVGSGTINDLSRFISFQLKLPYMVVATAPSMDGFASSVSPLIVNHMKTTYEAHAPYAILGDIKLLKEAPLIMTAAGIGDILGKYTCLCDWEAARIILSEYHCSTLEGMVRKSIRTVAANAEAAVHRDPETIRSIMEALVLSGIAMSFSGNSRPASGSEHHLAHYWEMMHLFEGKHSVLHGTEVGIATVAIIKAYELLMESVPDFTAAKQKASGNSLERWEAKMRETYGQAAPSVIRLEQEVCKNSPEKVVARLDLMEANWIKLKDTASLLPPADSIRGILTYLQAPADPMSIGIDRSTFITSFVVAKELRNRYGLLQMLFDLGCSEEIAGKVWDYFQSV